MTYKVHMLNILRTRIKQGYRTAAYPRQAPTLPERFSLPRWRRPLSMLAGCARMWTHAGQSPRDRPLARLGLAFCGACASLPRRRHLCKTTAGTPARSTSSPGANSACECVDRDRRLLVARSSCGGDAGAATLRPNKRAARSSSTGRSDPVCGLAGHADGLLVTDPSPPTCSGLARKLEAVLRPTGIGRGSVRHQRGYRVGRGGQRMPKHSVDLYIRRPRTRHHSGRLLLCLGLLEKAAR
jgi:hypothetical protein